jgi:HK97 gp10 family phage protein
MATQRFRIDGMDHALRQFKRAPVLAREYIGESIRVTEITLAQKVRNAAPSRTGALRHAIGSKTVGLKAQITIEEGGVYGLRPDIYWRFVEFGTVNHPAQPFIRPQAESEQEPMIQRIRNAGARLERTLG